MHFDVNSVIVVHIRNTFLLIPAASLKDELISLCLHYFILESSLLGSYRPRTSQVSLILPVFSVQIFCVFCRQQHVNYTFIFLFYVY